MIRIFLTSLKLTSMHATQIERWVSSGRGISLGLSFGSNAWTPKTSCWSLAALSRKWVTIVSTNVIFQVTIVCCFIVSSCWAWFAHCIFYDAWFFHLSSFISVVDMLESVDFCIFSKIMLSIQNRHTVIYSLIIQTGLIINCNDSWRLVNST